MSSFSKQLPRISWRRINVVFMAFFLVCCGQNTLFASADYDKTNFQNMPINIVTEGVTPKVMIATSNDHQLFYAAYNDYTDLDDDGIAEITYSHVIDYYGYFDSYKCYEYSTANTRFDPKEVTTDKYCNSGSSSGQWSGNFLNWVSMSRIDTMRKILFGGHRRTDSATTTILERAYLPHDAHSWAKYYSGEDLPKLTPFERTTDYDCDDGDLSGCSGDQSKIGVTFCNTTDVDMDNYNNKFSEDFFDDPPLIKVVKGNYSLWASNERWQCTWRSGAAYDNHQATNTNDSSKSGIYSYSDNPAFTESLGNGNYVARVKVCVDGLIGEENCKQYPDDNYKPIGILQTYGDDGEMDFGMVAGSYGKHSSGGVLIRNIDPMSDEINVATDGTFSIVSDNVSDNGVSNSADGLINAWSLYRIIGYDGDEGYYNNSQGDNCEWGLSSVADQTSSNRCLNWVNPFSEIYYQAINYLSGNGVIGDYRDNASSHIDGLPVPQPFKDPLDDDNYCADLYIVNLNTSSPSYDYDELDGTAYKPSTVWDASNLPGSGSTKEMTDVVGDAEGITGNSYFIGEVDVGSGTDNQLCTAKTITSFGDAGGMCPEEPRLAGSFRIAGLAYYAHTQDIRPADAGTRALDGTQVIDTYSVASSPGTPVIEIPNPIDTSAEPLVTILPACRNTSFSPEGNCALVAFKIVSQEVDSDSNTASGKFYINWEDSEMGGDHDQDMWGILSYELSADETLTITTQVHAESTPFSLGFGYIISGTDDDGFHVHSGIEGFTYTESLAVNIGSSDCSDADGCQKSDDASSKTYSLGSSDTKLLENPLWYAAKYGGFNDSDNDNLPNQIDEWDEEDNSTGESGSDGIPDNYFYATDPGELEAALTRVLDAILNRTSSGTSAAVVSSNVDGEGAVYSAYYEPSKKSADDSSVEATWLGTLTALWLDSFGYSRQDCTAPADGAIDDDGNCKTLTSCEPDGQLDNYCVDQVVSSFYDESNNVTRMRVYNSRSPDTFNPFSMQGVVTAYSTGSITMVPNSMEGMSSLTGSALTITPYELNGTVTSYDDTTGAVTISVADGDWRGPSGESFDTWVVTSDDSAVGYTTSSVAIAAGSTSFTLTTPQNGIEADDIITLKTKNLIGKSGETFEDWTIECLAGTSATGSISSGSEELSNNAPTVAEIVTDSGDFSSCTRAAFYSYNLAGTSGTEYSTWAVTNYDNNEIEGTSSNTIALANDGTITFSVSPSENWIEIGDRVHISNYTSSIVGLNDVSYLWNAREELYLSDLSDAEIAGNRVYSDDTSAEGRYITTWVDDNLNSIVDTGEYREFLKEMFSTTTSPVSYTFFDVDSVTDAEELVDYIRGVEKTDSRNRTIKYSTNDSDVNVMRLGDIVNSTPTTVSYPLDSFDLLYEDSSYSTFKQEYIDRRTVIYVGANDGMIHAFNGGFYNEVTTADGEEIVQYITSGKKHNGTDDAIAHPLGGEIWAYAPMNLLPHLQWLKDEDYADTHVSYIDSKPKVFDAKIFDTGTDHPGGWGTVMVVGMNLGGGNMTIDVDNDNDINTASEEFQARSSYVVMDITNPEVEPVLLGEITPPDGSFTTVYPAVAAFKDAATGSTNSWYLVFGTGPDSITTVESSQTAKAYLFDLRQLITGSASPTGTMSQDSCEINSLTTSYNIIACDTGISKTYMGTPVTVDWDLDFKADTLYYGLIQDAATTDFDVDTDNDSGIIMRMDFNGNADHTNWGNPEIFFDADRPISIYSIPLPAFDDQDNRWIFFGSGRYLASADKTSTEAQSIFGVKDYDDGAYPILNSDLLDVTDAEVYTDGTLKTDILAMDGSDLETFDEIEEEIDSDNAAGWFLDLPPITGTGTVPSTRNITNSVLFSSVLLSTVFQPSEDLCEGEGASRLYGIYYKTGTGFPNSPILGTTTEVKDGEVVYLTNTFIDLGTGNASSPSITTGSGTDTITAYTQVSTGVTIQTEVEAITEPRAGRTSWVDKDLSDY